MRPLHEIKADLRAMCEQLAIAIAAGYTEGVSYAKREILVLESELDFVRYKVWGVS